MSSSRLFAFLVLVPSLVCGSSISASYFADVDVSDPNANPDGNQGDCDGDGGEDDSDPIDLSTGGFQHEQIDFMIAGRGMDFVLTRMYRSYGGLQSLIDDQGGIAGDRDLIDGSVETPLGAHWDFNYNMRVSMPEPVFEPIVQNPGESPEPLVPDEHLPSIIDVQIGNGRVDEFDKYSPAAGVFASASPAYYSNKYYGLRVEYTFAHDPVYITDSELTTYEFFPGFDSTHTNFTSTSVRLPYAGRLKSITDRNGNKIEFYYETTTVNSVERLDYVIDTLGNTIDFLYHDESFGGNQSPLISSGLSLDKRQQLIWVIEDHAGRGFEYNYTHTQGFAVLSSVSLPAIVNDPGNFDLPSEHTRFASGTSWAYEYDDDPDLLWWSGRMLTKMKSPNGDFVVENEYEEIDGSAFQNFDRNDGRVKRQKYGNAYYNYIVTDTAGSINFPSGGNTSADYYVWVNDRRGAITRFKYAGSNSVSGFHRQLLEKVEFEGFVSEPDARIWATGTPGNYAWYKLNETTKLPVATSGPVGDSGLPESYSWSWQMNDNWNPTAVTMPVGDTKSISYADSSTTNDPRKWGAVTQIDRYSASTSEHIIEDWAYDFSYIGGCGCGSSGHYTGHSDGNGNVTIRAFDEQIHPVTGNKRGDLLAIYYDLSSGTISTTPAAAESLALSIERFTYNDHGQILTHTHPSTTVLDQHGAELEYWRVDQYEYYADTVPTNGGRLKSVRVDVNGEDLETIYEYDKLGNVVKVTHPDNDVSEYLYNQASQTVREQHFDDGAVLYAQTDYFYDANGNLVREEIMNLAGDPPQVQSNASLTAVYEYDEHGYMTRLSEEHGESSALITETDPISRKAVAPISDPDYATRQWDYDGAKNIVRFSFGQAVNQSAQQQSSNIISYEYDARDFLVLKTYGVGANEGDTVAVSAQYDPLGRATDIFVDEGGSSEQHHSVVYDGFDRILQYEDPMGNRSHFGYDNNNNLTSKYKVGTVGVDTGDPMQPEYTLSNYSYQYDARDRMTQRLIDIFDYDYATDTGPAVGSGPHGSSQQTVTYEYNRDSSLRRSTELSGDSLSNKVVDFFYDTVGRLETVEDNEFNSVVYEYDPSSNISRITRSDQPTLSGATVEIFTIDQVFDPLDRLASVTDGVGNIDRFEYDSRSNTIEMKDARGNTEIHVYDGMNRLIETKRILTDTGVGTGTQTGEIIRQIQYDDSSRVIKQINDIAPGESLGQSETIYAYDGLNRLISSTLPGGAQYTLEYDSIGNVKTLDDARGIQIGHEYDKNNRLVKRTVDTLEVDTFAYDGLGRLLEAENDNAKIIREYDSRSNIKREIQNVDVVGGFPQSSDRVVQYGYDAANNPTQIVYPNGRVIDREYDQLNRLLEIDDPSMTNPLTQFEYVGARISRRTHGNGTQTDYRFNGFSGAVVEPGDVGFGIASRIQTSDSVSSAVLDSFVYSWDSSQNLVTRNDTGSGMDDRRERTIAYDSADRLISSSTVYPEPGSTKSGDTTSYILDDDNNRISVSEVSSTGEGDAGSGLGSYASEGTMALDHQYTVTPREAGDEWIYQYDANGNMVLMALNVPADFTGDYELNYFDVSAFLQAHSNNEPEADFNGDGTFDFFDVSAFLAEYNLYPEGGIENRHYEYDFRNQLVSIEYRSDSTTVIFSVTNTHDPLARCVTQTVDDQVLAVGVQFVYGCWSMWDVLEQIDLQSGQTLTTHVFGQGLDDEIGYRVEGAVAPVRDLWTHRDDIGSLTSITDSTGGVIERYQYGDFGSVTVLDDAGVDRAASMYNAFHLYAGRPQIPGTGMLALRFRTLDPVTGRFLQRDPFGFTDSMNLYTYGGTSPYVYTDPFGLKKVKGSYKNGTGYYSVTYIHNGEEKTEDSPVHNAQALRNRLRNISSTSTIKKLTISTHHSTEDGTWTEDGDESVSDRDLAESINLDEGDGVEVNLESCNSGSLAKKIIEENPDADPEIDWTDGVNSNIPGTDVDVPAPIVFVERTVRRRSDNKKGKSRSTSKGDEPASTGSKKEGKKNEKARDEEEKNGDCDEE